MILASGSPQRRAILEQLGAAFEVVVPDVDELTAGPPEELVLENAFRKASAVATGLVPPVRPHQSGGDAGAAVLGVDTIVALGPKVYGKPADREDAAATLRALGGRSHRVLSGVCVIEDGRARTATAVTTVNFRPLGEHVLAWYLATDEWRGRAGGYAIQGRGAALVGSIDGDYLNVVGLPVATLLDLLPSLLFPALSLQ
ncbi:MAG TPA: Maf family protein [Solirubrobacteraceae bacterium]|nr:Maf family protein [Solirubrobacteraceae bacterium]